MKEIVVGSGLAVIIFLAVIGVNVTPLIFFAMVLGGFYFFIQTQGQMKFKDVSTGIKSKQAISFDDIGGQNTAIKELQEALEFILKADEIGKMGIRPLKGVLLVGPPGTGKTLLARAAATFTSSAYLTVSGSEFIEVYAGVGAKRVRQLFDDARKKARSENYKSAIIFIDELEILGAKRGSHSSHMEYDQTLNQLLVEMDGITPDEEPRILLIGATNRADMLDSALLRPGRFDRQVEVGLPDKRGRIKILEIHTRNKPLADNIKLEELARATFGFSGAHLESLTNEAAILALRENSKVLEDRHFTEAIDKVIMGEKLDRKPSAEEIERISIHESGHAVVSELVEPGSVSSLTVVPRGKALGFLRKSPQNDQYLYTRDQLEKQIMVALGGTIAEELKYGSRSTGARNDFDQAWSLAREIIETGLSSLGVVGHPGIPDEALFKECQAIIKQVEENTLHLLQSKYKLVEKIAGFMLKEETLDRTRFLELIKPSADPIAV
ncbi:MAG TPA: AAA family ATPase [Syntrophomonadaceae bacterium]|nr:AAA family ATPase [Syntrophomonadaceae bacterium]